MPNFFDESFVIAICFLVFLYFVYKPVKKSIISSLDLKIAQIQDDVRKSHKLRLEAEKLLQEIKKEIHNITEKQNAALDANEAGIKILTDARIQEIDAYFAKKKESLGKSADYETTKATKKLQAEFGEKLILLVSKYLHETKNNNKSDQELIEYFLKQQAD
jgi:F-type H+-transporting ATPase subunit b